MYDLAPLCDHRASQGRSGQGLGLDAGAIEPVDQGRWGCGEGASTMLDVPHPLPRHLQLIPRLSHFRVAETFQVHGVANVTASVAYLYHRGVD